MFYHHVIILAGYWVGHPTHHRVIWQFVSYTGSQKDIIEGGLPQFIFKNIFEKKKL